MKSGSRSVRAIQIWPGSKFIMLPSVKVKVVPVSADGLFHVVTNFWPFRRT